MTTVADPPKAGAPPRLKKLMPLVVVFLGALGWAGWTAWRDTRPYEWSGTVESRTITVGSRVGGRVKAVIAKEGATVVEGAPLVILEVGDLEAQRLVAQGQLEQAKAALEKLEKGARPEEIEAAKARAASARAAFQETAPARARSRSARPALAWRRCKRRSTRPKATRHARASSSRRKRSHKPRSTRPRRPSAPSSRSATRPRPRSTSSRNGARRETVAQAAARATEAEASMKLVTSGSRVEDIQAARGAVDAAEGRLKQVQVMLDELTIRAPQDARVESLDLRPGDILAPSAPAATLLEAGQLYVRIYVPETQIGALKPGAQVPVFVDSFPGYAFQGVVEHVDFIGQYTPRNLQTADERADQVFAARVGLRENEERLRAGMAAFVRVPR
ncbi:MAG: efflux RND transporter periplasmic adaptor subunit [Polyangiaceae bacterium]